MRNKVTPAFVPRLRCREFGRVLRVGLRTPRAWRSLVCVQCTQLGLAWLSQIRLRALVAGIALPARERVTERAHVHLATVLNIVNGDA